jgi:hypothetical protein
MTQELRNTIIISRKEEIIDLLIFLTLSLLSAALTLGSFQEVTDPVEFYNGFVLLGHFFSYRLDAAMDLPLFLPLVLIDAGLCTLFVYRRYQVSRTFLSRRILVVVVMLVLLRFVTDFAFPYGNVAFAYQSGGDAPLTELVYSGFSVRERIISFVLEQLYLLYFALAFQYVPTFSDLFDKVTDGFLVFFILLACVMTFYTYVVSSKAIIGNLKALFIDPSLPVDSSIQSFTSNRNAYGFFLLLGGISALVLGIRKPTYAPIFLVLMTYFTFTAYYVKTRTAFFLLLALLVLSLGYFALIHGRKNVSYLILFVLSLVAIVIFFTSSFFSTQVEKLIALYQDSVTMQARLQLNHRALAMLISPYLWLFGYGRIPFVSLYNAFGKAISQQQYWSSHNAFLDVLLSYGLVGLAGPLIANLRLVRELLLTLKRHDLRPLGFLVILAEMLVYTFAEPRMLFGMDGTEACLLFVLLFPILRLTICPKIAAVKQA